MRHVVVDTHFYKGNYPESCLVTLLMLVFMLNSTFPADRRVLLSSNAAI